MASPDKQPSNETRYDLSDFDLNMSLGSINSLSPVKIQHFNDENMDISNQLNSSDHGGSYNVLNCSLNSTLPGFVSSDDMSHDGFTLTSDMSLFSQPDWPQSPIATAVVSSTESDAASSAQVVYPLDQSGSSQDDSLVYTPSVSSQSLMSTRTAVHMLLELGNDVGYLSDSDRDEHSVSAEAFSPLTSQAIRLLGRSTHQGSAAKRTADAMEIDDTTEETRSIDSQSDNSSKRVRRDDMYEESESRAPVSLR